MTDLPPIARLDPVLSPLLYGYSSFYIMKRDFEFRIAAMAENHRRGRRISACSPDINSDLWWVIRNLYYHYGEMTMDKIIEIQSGEEMPRDCRDLQEDRRQREILRRERRQEAAEQQRLQAEQERQRGIRQRQQAADQRARDEEQRNNAACRELINRLSSEEEEEYVPSKAAGFAATMAGVVFGFAVSRNRRR